MLLALLPVLSLGPLLSACGDEVASTPPAHRFAPVAAPTAPEGEALCEGEPCLSDRQFGSLFDAVVDALETANQRLEWLRDYYHPGE
jgi:hypothetical protein